MTVQWDASVTVPSTVFYGIKAPGYTDGTRMRFECSHNAAGQVLCYSYAAGLGYNGGTGNPGDVNGQYGWHVQLIEEAADHTWGKVKIWNAMRAVDHALTVDKTRTAMGWTLQYDYSLQNTGSLLRPFVCIPIDSSKATYVDGSATNGAMPLSSSCATAAMALESNAESLNQLRATGADPVNSITWQSAIGTGESVAFSFKLTTKKAGTLSLSARLVDMGSTFTASTSAATVTILPPVYLPIVSR